MCVWHERLAPLVSKGPKGSVDKEVATQSNILIDVTSSDQMGEKGSALTQ